MSTKAVVGWSLSYWLCAGFIILMVGALGDCFESKDVCEASAREGRIIVAGFFGAVYAVVLLVRFAVARRR